MAYYLIAQTESKQHLGDAYQLFVYQNLASAPGSVVTLELLSDFVLRRGNAGTKNKNQKILFTEIKFKIKDYSLWLSLLMKDSNDIDFKGILKKNGSDFFTGFLTTFLNKYDFSKTNVQLDLSLYDGLKLLENYKDFNQTWATQLSSMGTIFYNILNTLFPMDLITYTNMYPSGLSSPVPIEEYGFKVSDLLSKQKGLNYYDLLQKILSPNFTLFQNNNKWVLRQNIFMTSSILKCTTTSSGSTVTSVNPTNTLIFSDLNQKPLKIFCEKYGEVKLSSAVYKKPIFYNEAGWVNGDFLEGENGWTVEQGTVIFCPGALKIMSYGDYGRVSQTPPYIYNWGDSITFNLKSLSSVYYKTTDGYGENWGRFASVKFFNDYTSQTFWMLADGTWQEEPPSGPLYCATALLLPNHRSNADRIAGYGKVLLDLTIDSVIPGSSGYGNITVYLHGGCTPIQSPLYPYDIPAQHISCFLKLKEIVSNADTPAKTISYSVFNENNKVLDLELEFHDDDPYNDLAFYEIGTGKKTIKWAPGDMPLLELLSTKLVKFNYQGMFGLDINVDPAKTITIEDLISYESKNYLIMYEETELIGKKQRIFAIEHNEGAGAITTKRYYI